MKRLSQLRGALELLSEMNIPFIPAWAWAVTGIMIGWMEPSFCRAL